MRILAIRGSNIASLTEFDIDFLAEPLRSAGIFAITGPTGAGKSSLLDAMCLALYQRAPRLDDLSGREAKVETRFGAIGQSDIRNLLRRGCDTGHAECDFLGQDGRAYRSRWGYRAPKKKGASVQEEVTLVCLDDQRVLASASGKKGDFQNQILSLVGLTYNQFMRTVMLAQGRFAEFLRSNEDERADLLEKLTGTEIYGRISKRVFEKTKQAEIATESVKRDLDALSVLEESVREAKQSELATLESGLPLQEATVSDLRRFLEGLDRLVLVRANRTNVSGELVALRRQTQEGLLQLQQLRVQLDTAEEAKRAAGPEIENARSLDTGIETARKLSDRSREAKESARDALRKLEVEQRTKQSEFDVLAKTMDDDRVWLQPRKVKLEPLASDWSLWQERLRQADQIRQDLVLLREQERRSHKGIAELEEKCGALIGELDAIELPENADAAIVQMELENTAKRRTSLQLALGWIELRQECALREENLASWESRLAHLEPSLGGLEAAWNLARRLLEETKVALSGDVAHLRETLQEGASCPVCGSIEHPWAKLMPALDSLLSRHQQEESASRNAFEIARSEREGLKVRIGSESQNLANLRRKIELIVLDQGIADEALGQERPLEWAHSSIEGLQEVEKAGFAKLKSIQLREGIRSRLRESQAQREVMEASEVRDRERVVLAAGALDECLCALDVPFGSPQWRAKWEENPAFVSKVTESVIEFLGRRDAFDANARKSELLQASMAALVDALDSKRVEAEKSSVEWELSCQDLAKRLENRREVLGGKSVADTEALLDLAIANARKALDERTRHHEGDALRLASLEGQESELIRQESAQLHELALFEGRIFTGSEPCEDVVTRREMAKNELVRSESDLSAKRRELAELSMALAQDRANRSKAEVLSRKLANRKSDLENWSALNTQIGSADGKLFKRIAQQFTLELLLDEANGQLLSIAPRYSLRMLGNSMHFGVLDHESYEEMRPVQTLSGGETFLVSLGLALGLSRMAGGDLSVESLFIDEGFGTLDPETLQGVMAALSSLHAQGRQVGLITHVEEMKDQIPVRIEVVKLGQGTSRVEVRG